jgi:molecular chaperone GrpE (heat shock protein)
MAPTGAVGSRHAPPSRRGAQPQTQEQTQEQTRTQTAHAQALQQESAKLEHEHQKANAALANVQSLEQQYTSLLKSKDPAQVQRAQAALQKIKAERQQAQQQAQNYAVAQQWITHAQR